MYQSDAAPWLEFYAWNTDGSAKTDLVYNTSGISIIVVRDNLANSSALTLSAASGPTDWAAGKFWAMGGNKYRVGIATASISSFTGQISVEGSYTGGVLTGVTREVSAYDPTKNPLSPLVAGRQIAVSATTGKVTAEAVELDSASIDAIWDEVLTGATHNIASSAGRRLRQLADTVVLVDGQCTGATNTGTDSTGTITLAEGTTTACVGQAIRCENQVRFIASYDAGTRVAQLDRPWCVVPDAGDEYVIFNVRNPLVGLASLALAGSTAAAVNEILVDTGTTLPAQIAGIEGGGNGSSVNVLPAVGIVANRSPGVTLLPVVGETISQSITLYQTDGTTPVDLGGKTLKIIFETLSGADVAVVLNNDITVSGADDNVVTFAYPSAVTASERVLKFALRDAAAPLTMYLQGVCSVVAAPKVDA
jgi:hypothetical protein